MRVPTQLQGAGALTELDLIRSRSQRAASELSSGLRVQKPSDDPVAASRGNQIRDRLSQLEHYREGTGRAESEVHAVDNVLDQLERLMDVAITSGARGRSGLSTPTQFQALADEVDSIREEILRLANSEHRGSSLFAGRQTRTQAFVDSGGVVTYQGDSLAPTSRVGDQSVVETTIPGDGLFVTGGDVFQVLADLRDALASGDTDRVRIEMQNAEQVGSRFTDFRARLGSTMQELSRHSAHLSSENVLEQTNLSREIDTDLVDAISRLTAADQALQAALGAGGRLLTISLMDVLG